MKPLTLTLPDDVRDALEAELTHIAMIDDPDAREFNAAEVVAEFLYDERNNDDWQNNFRDQLLKLQTGMGTPAVLLENLPPTQEKLFAIGLSRLLGRDMREPDGLRKVQNTTEDIEFHQDLPFTSLVPTKRIRFLMYDEISNHPQETMTISADEVIHAHICESMHWPADTPLGSYPPDRARYESLRAEYIEILKAAKVQHKIGEDEKGEPIMADDALLHRNPNYKKGNGAPEFFISPPERNEWGSEAFKDTNGAILWHHFNATEDALLCRAKKETTAGTKPHSMLIWNDALVRHARSGKTLNAELPTIPRLALSLHAQPNYWGEATSENQAVGYPATHIALSSDLEREQGITSKNGSKVAVIAGK